MQAILLSVLVTLSWCLCSCPAASSQRLSAATLDALGEPDHSSCMPQKLADPKVGKCAVQGPYPGEITTGTPGASYPKVGEALAACEADPACVGVTTNWYVGAPWRTVSGATEVKPNASSYGCQMLLRCP